MGSSGQRPLVTSLFYFFLNSICVFSSTIVHASAQFRSFVYPLHAREWHIHLFIYNAQNLATFPCLGTLCHCPMQPSSINSSSMVRPLVICSATFPLRFWRSRQCRICWHITGHYEDMAESFTFFPFHFDANVPFLLFGVRCWRWFQANTRTVTSLSRKQETGNIYSSQRQQNRVFNTKTIQYITYMSTW